MSLRRFVQLQSGCRRGHVCENECPQGTDADKEALARYGLIDNVVGKECSGHGTCNAVTALCECDPEFSVLAVRTSAGGDENMNICSGNGTCVYTRDHRRPVLRVRPFPKRQRVQIERDYKCILRVGAVITAARSTAVSRRVSSARFLRKLRKSRAPRLPRPFRLLAALILTTLFFS